MATKLDRLLLHRVEDAVVQQALRKGTDPGLRCASFNQTTQH